MNGKKERRILTQKEIENLLMEGGIEQIYVVEKLDKDKYDCEITWLPEEILEGIRTKWKIDVWNCHGVLKKAVWGLGYGCEPHLEGGEYIDIGWFSIPVREGYEITDDEKDKLVKVLFEIIERTGAINMSGWYPVSEREIEKVREIIGEKLYEGD